MNREIQAGEVVLPAYNFEVDSSGRPGGQDVDFPCRGLAYSNLCPANASIFFVCRDGVSYRFLCRLHRNER